MAHLAPSGNSRAMQPHPRFARQPLIQSAHVRPTSAPCVSRQTACLACVSAAGISDFTARRQIKARPGCRRVTGRGVACRKALGSCVNHPARLSSEDPRGVLSLSDGLTLEPRKLQSREDLDCVSNKYYCCCLVFDARCPGSAHGIHIYAQFTPHASFWANEGKKTTTENYSSNTGSFCSLFAVVSCILPAHVWGCNKRTVKCNTSPYKKGNRRNSKQRPSATVCAATECFPLQQGGIHPGRWRGRGPWGPRQCYTLGPGYLIAPCWASHLLLRRSQCYLISLTYCGSHRW